MRRSPCKTIASIIVALAGLAAASGNTVAASLPPVAAAAPTAGYTTAPTDWTPRCHIVRVCAHWASGACDGWTNKRSCPGGMGGGN